MFIRGSLCTLLVGGIVLSATGLLSTISTSAADRSPANSQRGPASQRPSRSAAHSSPQSANSNEDDANVPQVRLNHINLPWAKVLRKLSKETGSLLVMHDVPPGRFSRTDLQKYTRTEAVQILNQQLEPKGFRILEKGRYLTVLEMQRARSTYRRPVSPLPATQTRRGTPAVRFTGAGDAIPLEPTAAQTQGTARPRRDFFSITEGLKRDRTIRQAGGIDRRGKVITSNHEVLAAEENVDVAEAVIDSTFRPRHRNAVDIAKLLQTSFRSRSKLLDAGPHKMPALQVFDNSENSNEWPRRHVRGVWFTVEIDIANNSLLVEAADQTTRGLINLMQRLDVPPVANEPAMRLVSGTPETMHIGRQLQPELARLRQRRSADARQQPFQERGDTTLPPSPQTDQFAWQAEQRAPVPPAAGQTAPPGAPDARQIVPGGPARVQDQLPAILSGLRGEVIIEALPDLNILILRGNEQDIAQVMQVIDRIEQLAVGSRPDIHLLFLQHINSHAVAELLNSLYDELEELNNANPLQSAQTVSVVPVGTPNAILILAPQAAMESILQLAGELDKPGDPRSEVEIFPLRFAVASQAKDLLDEFYAEPEALEPRISVSADIRTNSLIVHARPNDLEEVRLIIRKIDRGSSPAANQLRVIPLQHAAADELAEFLNTTIQGILNPPRQTTGGGGGFGAAATQGPEELRTPKSVVLEFLTTDGVTQRLVRSGLLSDVRVTADLRTNSLTVAAPKQTLELLIELIDILDQPSATVADIKVFQLENADAATAVVTLTELFESDEEDALGIAIAGAEDASSSLIPLKFSTDVRTNSVIAIGGAEALRVVEAILLRLDQSNIRQRQNDVIKLHNSFAEDVAAAINLFVQAQLDLLQFDQEQVSAKEIIDQTFIVVPDATTNSLIISASPRYFDEIVRLTKELDAEPPQVMIQALLVEVELDDTDEFGIELGFQDPVLFRRSVTTAEDLLTILNTFSDPSTGIQTTTESIISQAALPGFLFNNRDLGNNIAGNPSRVGSQGLSSFALGRTNGDLGFGGLVLSAGSDSVSVLVRALESRRDVRILSRPQIMALDNQTATIQEGQTVPIIDGFTPSNLSNVPTVEQRDVGIILEVTPRISSTGQVVMLVTAQKSGLSGQSVPLIADATTGGVIESPIIDVTLAQTTVKVNDGQTVVLGGMIIEEDFTLERKVPWIGDMPLIGQLFRFDSNRHRRSELLVFLTPRIIYNDADFELIKQVETERLHFFENEAEEVHGPLFGVPPEAANVPPGGRGYRYENEFAPGGEVPSEPTFPLHLMPPEGVPTFPNDPSAPFKHPTEVAPGPPENSP